jgi:F420-dependent oxidoreductase-like protein
MRFSVWPSPVQPWESTLEVALNAERKGYDGVWYADHFMPNAEDVSGPTNEAWTTIAALAVAVPRVRIGPLVTGNTYRHPAVLAKMAATVDNISGGRLVLGLGAGWQENEHQKYGIEFSTLGGRMRRFEEACQVIKGLFTNDRTTFAGKHYQLDDAPLVPKPVQSPLPLLIGGGGEKVTMRIAAKYADEWNVWGDPAVLRQKVGVLEAHCRDIGRDPGEIKRSAQAMLVLTDDAALIERMRGSGRPVIAGNPDQVADVVQAYADAGVDELIIPDFNLGTGPAKLATYDRFWDEVAVRFR